jgi:hypothetical protein
LRTVHATVATVSAVLLFGATVTVMLGVFCLAANDVCGAASAMKVARARHTILAARGNPNG